MADLFVLVQGQGRSLVCCRMLTGVSIVDVSGAYNMRASLFFSRINASIWMPKMTSEVARAVTKATKLIPSEF